MPKKIIFAIVAMILVSLSVSQDSCSDKFILDSNRVITGNTYSDVTKAYNGPASCATLKLDNGGYMCCYIKIKFKNENLDEKFTHKGCYEITDSDSAKYVMGDYDDFDFKDVIIGGLENSFDTANRNLNLTYKSISVDCSSKYLNLVGFALLFMLL